MSQKQAVLKHLKKHKTITSRQAFTEYGVTRLSGIIYKLRWELGLNIESVMRRVKTRYNTHARIAEYTLRK